MDTTGAAAAGAAAGAGEAFCMNFILSSVSLMAPDGDAAAFEAAEPKSLGEQASSFFAAVKAFLAGSPEIGGFLAGIVVLVLYKTLLLEKPAPVAADGPATPVPAPKPRGNPKKNK